jgi:hypothetical protein
MNVTTTFLVALRHSRMRFLVSTNLPNYLSNGISDLAFELGGSLARLTCQVGGKDMDERRIARLFGLILGGLFACSLVLNAFAY